MPTPTITTREKLQDYLHHAMELEHATIPPYLLALYSIHPGTNSDATHILRVVVVEEMLHLTLAANLLNAVGGTPNPSATGFVPHYPTGLPDGETDFEVSLTRFSRNAVETFLKIERPGHDLGSAPRLVSRKRPSTSKLGACRGEKDMHYYSIGDFYKEIALGLEYLYQQMGGTLFCGDVQKQVTAEYYYSGGGGLFPVTDQKSALAALDLIIGQGEGATGRMYDDDGELAHYYRFLQLKLGKYFQKGDKADAPSGPALKVNWDAVHPIKANARLADYTTPELRAAAVAFNNSYKEFLALLTAAYNGAPRLLLQAVPQMFKLRDQMCQLIHNPIPGMDGVNAAPTFEIEGTAP